MDVSIIKILNLFTLNTSSEFPCDIYAKTAEGKVVVNPEKTNHFILSKFSEIGTLISFSQTSTKQKNKTINILIRQRCLKPCMLLANVKGKTKTVATTIISTLLSGSA